MQNFRLRKGKYYAKTCHDCQRVKTLTPKAFFAKNISQLKRRRPVGPDINSDFMLGLMEKQNHKCVLTGLELTTTWGKGEVDTNASVDRMDNDRGYTRDNIRLVCRRANTMRGKLTDEDFIRWCKLVIGTTVAKGN